ncbi:MAG: serine--tRNA ligase [Bacteroidales bacterium]|nr:serine--tRNA ligase [Bacteroidales bacterium]MBP5723148.1 serine--tRNA ligase [Bacteroidales bacterium]MBR4498328.1 serine--tRNA ligase [Bacteroidales bacterium]
MLTVQLIRENPEFVVKRLAIKNFDAKEAVEKIIALDEKRIAIQKDLNAKQSEINSLSKEIGALFAQKKVEEANAAKEKTGELKEAIKNLDQEMTDVASQLQKELVLLPNLPAEIVPAGKNADDNVVVKSQEGVAPMESNLLCHWDLAEKYNLIDFELGNKLTGAGFPVYVGVGAKLQRALISFFLDRATAAGYKEYQPPIMVNEASGFGTGQLPDKEGQMYYVGMDNLYLIPTAEVPVTNIFRDVIVKESDFPIKCTAYTPCFRREAGSYGKDVRGLNRLHQFDKVEIVRIEHPERSYQALDEMVAHVESLVQALGLTYRIVRLCGGDMSFTSALTYDFEVFSAGQKRWLEVSSVSNFETFQANRLKLRYKDEKTKKTVLAHTLNGSALALPRIVASILENYQTADGIKVPDVLVPYMGGLTIIK